MVLALQPFKKADRLTFNVAAALLLLAGMTLIGIFIDDRVIAGQNVWIKPFKFSMSFAIFLLTIGWVIQYLPHTLKSRYSSGFVFVIMVEILAIYIQAIRGRTSHYNFETALDIFFYASMGVAIAINTILLITLIFHLSARAYFLPSTYVRSIQFGLILSVIGSFIGVIMSAHKGHTFGGIDGGPGIPLFNWSILYGDLRFAHFIGLHGLQVMVGLGYLLCIRWQSTFSARVSSIVTWAAFVIFFGATFIAATTALLGNPFYFPVKSEFLKVRNQQSVTYKIDVTRDNNKPRCKSCAKEP